MQTYDIVKIIKALFPPSQSVGLISALRQDGLVWASLNQEEYIRLAATGAGSNIENWTPANLALIGLGSKLSGSLLGDDSIIPPGIALQRRAVQFYEEMLKNPALPSSLPTAGLLALALRERRRLTGNWNGLRRELERKPAAGLLSMWKTPLACLYGMIPDPADMIREMMVEPIHPELLSLVGHVLLSGTLTEYASVENFLACIVRLPLNMQVTWLKQLSLQNRISLVEQLATILVKTQPEYSLEKISSIEFGRNPSENIYQKVEQLQHLAILYSMAGKEDEAEHIQLIQYKGLNMLSIGSGIVKPAFQGFAANSLEVFEAITNDPSQISSYAQLMPELVLNLGDQVENVKYIDTLAGSNSHAIVKLWAAARIARDGDYGKAQLVAQEAVRQLMDASRRGEALFAPTFLYRWEPANLLRPVTDAGLYSESLECALMFMQSRPVDLPLIKLVRDIYIHMGDMSEAIHYGWLAVSLTPENADLHRQLAELLEMTQEWGQALEERKRVVELSASPQAEDWTNIAEDANRLEDPNGALEAARKALELHSNYGPAFASQGKSYYQLGEYDEAKRFLGLANVFAPDDISAWLLLVQIYREQNAPDKVLDTLQTAMMNAPSSVQVLYELARYYIDTDRASEALPILQEAIHLAPESAELAYQLGKCLFDMGQPEESLVVTGKARARWPMNQELAYLFALAAVELGNLEEALPALEVAVQLGAPDADRYVLYADVILGTQLAGQNQQRDTSRIANAQQALKQALTLMPDHFQGRLLLAEILAAKEDYDSAYAMFRQIEETAESKEVKWRRRVQVGMAQVAMRLGFVDTALAALQDASQVFPDDLGIQQLLAEAFLQADLKQEAFQSARFALKLKPDDQANLSWNVDIMSRLGKEAEAVHSLICLTQLAPECAHHWVSLAEAQLKLGELENARESLQMALELEMPAEDYPKVAITYLRLDDVAAALECLQKAVERQGESDSAILVDMALLHCAGGNIDQAINFLQEAIEKDPDNYILRLLTSDLLASTGRIQAAYAYLEYVQNAYENGVVIFNENAMNSCVAEGLIAPQWLESLHSPVHIHLRMINLLNQLGHMRAALNQAELALKEFPFDWVLRWATAELSASLLENEKADAFISESAVDGISQSDYVKLPLHDRQAVAGMQALRAEIAMESLSPAAANPIVQSGTILEENNLRLLCCQARLVYRQGDERTSTEILERVFSEMKMLAEGQLKDLRADYSPKKYLCLDLGDLLKLAAGTCAMDLRRWDDAVALTEQYQQAHPESPRAQLHLARLMVSGVEAHRQLEELRCRKHNPGGLFLSQEYEGTFNQAIEIAGKLSASKEVERWKARGVAAYHPDPQNARSLASIAQTADDHAALIAVLRQINLGSSSAQIGARFPNQPRVLLECALSLVSSNASDGLAWAQRGVEINPMDPLQHVVFALCAEKDGKPERALGALEISLSIWADESEWHAWAADLAEELGKQEAAAYHWQQAVALNSDCVFYVVSLGKVYLNTNNSSRAVDLLSRAVRLAPNSMENWIYLAQAYRQTGMIGQALECAERASGLSPDSPMPVLMAGEIAMDMDHLEQATECAQEAFRRDPKCEPAIMFFSKVLTINGRMMEALALVEHALPDLPNSLALKYEYSRLTRSIHGAPAALPLLVDLARMYPEEINVLVMLANVQMETGDNRSAEAVIREGLRMQPMRADLNYLMGRLQHLAGQLDQAIHYLSEAVRQSPDHLDAYLELGKAYENRREFIHALRTYQQAMKLAPSDYRAYFFAGMALKESKDYAGAEVMLRRAAALAPDEVQVRKQLGAVITLNLVHNTLEELPKP